MVPKPDCPPLADPGTPERTYFSRLVELTPGQEIPIKVPAVSWSVLPLGVTVSFLSGGAGITALLGYDDGTQSVLNTLQLPDRCPTNYPFYPDSLLIRLRNGGSDRTSVQLTAYRWTMDAP